MVFQAREALEQASRVEGVDRGVFVERFLAGREFTALVSGDELAGVHVYTVVERVFNTNLKTYQRILAFDRYWDGYDLDGTAWRSRIRARVCVCPCLDPLTHPSIHLRMSRHVVPPFHPPSLPSTRQRPKERAGPVLVRKGGRRLARLPQGYRQARILVPAGNWLWAVGVQ